MSKYRVLLATLLCGLVLTLSVGCPVSTLLRVTFPTAGQTTSQDFSIDSADRIEITVNFNKAVDFSSIMPQTNVILVTENFSNTPITVSQVSSTQIVVRSVDTAATLLNFDPDGFFSLEISGAGANAVRDTGGIALDGDGDGIAGGTYQTGFVLIG